MTLLSTKPNYINFIAVLLCVTSLACRQSAKQTIAQKNKDLPAYIIFGRFCGECSGHCATMYRYKVTNNSDRLFVDSTDSYFRNHGKVLCNTPVKDTGKFRIVDILVQHIPAAFLNTGRTQETFGCPDCTDGCGLYFELMSETTVRRFYIDYRDEGLDKEIVTFREFVKTTLDKLEN